MVTSERGGPVRFLHPRRILSDIAHRATRIRFGPVKNRQIRWFVHRYGVDLSEAVEPEPHNYQDFNAFFTRALRPGARPLPQAPDAVISPADGTLIETGTVARGTLLQAKGKPYRLPALLGGNTSLASELEGGTYLTIYLAPRDYHRVHSPLAASVHTVTFVPGRRFSVAAGSVARIPELFTRNERVVFELDTGVGRIALVMVGALCVSSIETAWSGPVTGPHDLPTTRWIEPGVVLARGQEMARFAMGSTVILVVPPGAAQWQLPDTGAPVRLGQALGTLAAAPADDDSDRSRAGGPRGLERRPIPW